LAKQLGVGGFRPLLLRLLAQPDPLLDPFLCFLFAALAALVFLWRRGGTYRCGSTRNRLLVRGNPRPAAEAVLPAPSAPAGQSAGC